MFKKKIAKSVDPAKTNKYFSKVFYACVLDMQSHVF